MKKSFILLSCLMAFLLTIDDAQCSQKFDIGSKSAHYYMNNYKPTMYARGHFISISGGTYYSHSKSKLKRKRHAERLQAYNAKNVWH